MKLAFLGAPRTSTKSTWDALSKHPEIAESKIKELFNRSIYKDIFPRKYFDEFKITKRSKILLDGTPCAYHFFKRQVEKINIEKKVIYILRNPFDRLYSSIKLNCVIRSSKDYEIHKNPQYPSYITYNGRLITKNILEYLPKMLDDLYIRSAYEIANEVYITRFDKSNINDMLEFMKVFPMNIELKRRNSMDFWENDPQKPILDAFWNDNLKEIAKIVLTDLYKVNDKINVEDWIIETENILSNV